MLLLFAACYLPAGFLVGVLRLDPVPAVPVLVVAALFGAVHLPAGVAAAAAALLLGIAAGALRARTGSVLPAIFAHAAANVVGSLDRFL